MSVPSSPVSVVRERLQAVVAEVSQWETTTPIALAPFKLHENAVLNAEGRFAALRGPLPDRGSATGLVLWKGERVASWGMPDRADTAFSVTKSAFSILAGIALTEGRIDDIDEPVCRRVSLEAFSGERHSQITWRQLLNLTSEWTGELWGLPDQIDYHRYVPKRSDTPPKGTPRALFSPGEHWEFNDVRVNLLALALTHVFDEGLEHVFSTRVMMPIGANDGWRWHGFDDVQIQLATRRVLSVVGGGHWGGGWIMSGTALSLYGQLHLQRGQWNGRALLSERWFDQLREASPQNPAFGLMWWVNHGRQIAVLSEDAIWASGIANFLVIDPQRDLVVVLRWYDVPRRDALLAAICDALP